MTNPRAYDLVTSSGGIVGFVYHYAIQGGWTFISNTSARRNGRKCHETAEQAVPRWCRKMGAVLTERENLSYLRSRHLVSAADQAAMISSLEKRNALTLRLVAALAHLERGTAIAIVSAFIPLNELEETVRFQERS